MSKHILSVGDLVLDLVMPVQLPIEAFSQQSAPSRRFEPGGAGNVILAARHMGAKVTSVGAVGDDPFGEILINTLQREGIDTRFIEATPGTTSTLVLVFSDPAKGQHAFVGSYGEGKTMEYPPTLNAEWDDIDGSYMLGYTFVEHRTKQLAKDALKKARQFNKPVYFDVGPMMGYLPDEDIKEVVEQVDILLTTEEEMRFVSGERRGQEAYDYILGLGVDVIVVKQDKEGCTVVTKDMNQSFPAFKTLVVDAVGAGDCFGAAFMLAHLHDYPLDQCAQIANAMGSATVKKLGGGRNVPTKDEVQTVLVEAGLEITLP